MPTNPSAKVLHIGDPIEMGKLTPRFLEHPNAVGAGPHLAQASALTNW